MAEQVRAASPAALMQLVLAFRVSQALHVTATLGIADLLAAGPRPAADLAQATGTHPRALYRLLRAVASVGVLAEDGAGAFALTDLGQFLRADHPRSVHGNGGLRGAPHDVGDVAAPAPQRGPPASPPSATCTGSTPGRTAHAAPRRRRALRRRHDQQLAPAARRGGGRLRLLRRADGGRRGRRPRGAPGRRPGRQPAGAGRPVRPAPRRGRRGAAAARGGRGRPLRGRRRQLLRGRPGRRRRVPAEGASCTTGTTRRRPRSCAPAGGRWARPPGCCWSSGCSRRATPPTRTSSWT